ncbi:MAG: AAA family ATPase [Candidatus Competibacteraceae bacterium]|nr:AAA family ATPase [Candidatus Competibacteraceae bacterium]
MTEIIAKSSDKSTRITLVNPTAKRSPPPSNPVAEAAIIAGLVNCGDPAEIGAYALDHRLALDCFTLPAYRNAYDAILELAADGQPVDIAIIAQRLDAEDLAAVDSACREHVSAANFGVYARLLHGCKQRRSEAAARDRLAQAAAAGVPDHELLAIVESVRQASAGDTRECRLTEISSLCDLPPSESWLIKRYLPADSLTVMFGSPGCGKSFAAIDLACHVAIGRAWCGQPVKKGRVVYVAGEGRNGLSKRFRAWFDTLNRNFGPGDENSTADMTKAVAGLDAIRTATGAAILGIHHSGHVEKGRGRGSSVLLGAVDAEYAAEMMGNTVQLRSTKMKDSDPPLQLAWTLEKQNLPWCDEEGVPMDSAVLVPSDIQIFPASTTGRLSAGQRIALDALRSALMAHGAEDNGVVTVSEDEWREAAYDAGIASIEATQSARRKAFLRARLDLVSSGKVSTDDGRYWIPSPSGTRRDKTPTESYSIPTNDTSFSPTDSHFGSGTSGTSGTKRDNVPSCPARQDGSEAVQNGTHPYRGVPHVPPAGAPILEDDAQAIADDWCPE